VEIGPSNWIAPNDHHETCTVTASDGYAFSYIGSLTQSQAP
jgi:hypothetical protein